MVDAEKIRVFVRKTLRCGCPEEVFRSLDCRRTVPLYNEVVLNSVVIVGNRLLIYVFEPTPKDVAERHLAVLVTAGKQERDSRGLNRFRLVIVTDDAAEKERLLDLFHMLQGKDEKMHLHVIKKAENIFAMKTEAEKED